MNYNVSNDGIWRLKKLSEDNLKGWYMIRWDGIKKAWIYRKMRIDLRTGTK